MNNKWIKYLTEAGEYRQIHPNEFYNGSNHELFQDFLRMWKNRFFRERLYSDLYRLEIKPLMDKMSSDERKTFYALLRHSYHNDFMSYEVKEVLKRTIFRMLGKDNVLYNSATHFVLFYFQDLINLVDKDKFDEDVRTATSSWFKVFVELYKKHNLPQVKLPVLNKAAPDTSSNINRNLVILSTIISNKETLESLRSEKILHEIRIGAMLGSGAYGVVFEISGTNRAIKIFEDGVDLKKDLKRMNLVMNQVFEGTASLEDMHYFDYGKLGASGKYYAIMPKIIPLRSTSLYKKNRDAMEQFFDWLNGDAFTKYVTVTDSKGGHSLSRMNPMSREEISKRIGSDTVRKIESAYYRAGRVFNGQDRHSGNIGFLAQKPDVFFYYDM